MLFIPARLTSFKLPKRYVLKSWFFPGRWLSDAELDILRQTIYSITMTKLGVLPKYGVYSKSREPYKNRIISIAYDKITRTPIGFTAMVHIQLPTNTTREPVIHLGLVITTTNRLGRALLFFIYFWPLLYFLTIRKFKPFWITSVSMEPSIIGSVSDNFGSVFPHYLQNTTATAAQCEIAQRLFCEHGDEFGMGQHAHLDLQNFVVRGSCRGPSDALRVKYDNSAKYITLKCNKFCELTLDYERGDEILQVGHVSLRSSLSVFARLFRDQMGRLACAIEKRRRI
ncbi:MAG: hypothetical protein OEV79_08530 [candidate division WOR-3 bacterium]|nr:hypothetical protein [candidate division WOR-3 bacterium]